MAPTNHENSVSTVPKSGARDITIVIRLSHLIMLLVATSASAILLGLICFRVAPFFDKYQNLSEDLKTLQTSLKEINETSKHLQINLLDSTKKINSIISEITDLKTEIKGTKDQIIDSGNKLNELQTKSDNLLKEQEKATSEINIAVKNLKNMQESINMIASQNNALQSGNSILIQRFKETEANLQAIKDLINITHRK